jgi:phenylacetic acid degradation operon negative regulatory protein
MEMNGLVRGLVSAFNRRKPVRAGSLIITLYGDAIATRGGSLSLGDITQILGLFRIDGGHVRTATSRLTTEKWLERKKVGRNTFYRLSKQGEGAFSAATRRIYFPRQAEATKHVHLALLNGEAGGRAALRKKLEAANYAAFNALTYVSAETGDPALKSTKGMQILDVPIEGDAAEILRTAFKLESLAAQYNGFITQFVPIREGFAKEMKLEDTEALVVRLLLIQEFRRIVLRDPLLPRGVVPDWPGECARQLAGEIYGKVLQASERYLDRCQADEKNALPRPNSELFQRFATPQ